MRYFTGLLILVALSFSGCGMFASKSPSKYNEIYRQGVQAFENKRYDEALRIFRRIPTSASQYPKTLKVIEKIPYQKGRDALNAKNYVLAMKELSAVLPNSKYYDSSQALRRQAEYKIQSQRYERASLEQRQSMLPNLITVAAGASHKESLMDAVERVNDEVRGAVEPLEVIRLLPLLRKAAQSTDDPDVTRVALRDLTEAFKRFHDDPDLRQQILYTIAILKQ